MNTYFASFGVERVTPEKVFIVDASASTGMKSVTNDAENVCKQLYNFYGQKRFIYQDTEGQWDELVHTAGKFERFSPYNEEHP